MTLWLYVITLENILKYAVMKNIIHMHVVTHKLYNIHVDTHKLYKSKFSKTKLITLHKWQELQSFEILPEVHLTQSTRQNFVYKLFFSQQKIKTYESSVSIIKLGNLAKLRKWKSKYTIQFLKLNPPFTTYLGKSSHMVKKNSNPLNKFFENQKPLL